MTFTCAPNFRDLGGIATGDGGRVRRGLLLRAEAIASPSDDEARALAALGVRLVCDLRSARERQTEPGHWPATGVTVLEMDIVADIRAQDDPLAAMRGDPSAEAARRLMLATYEALPDACAPHLGTLFARLADGETPALIHCTAGKDRTGVLCALLLSALGAPTEAVMADYLRSGDCPNPAVIAATHEIMSHALGRAVDDAAMAALSGVSRDYLNASFARLARDHGSLEGYLRDAAGIDKGLQRAVADRLVERD